MGKQKGKRGGHGEVASTAESKEHDAVVKQTSWAVAKALIAKGDFSVYFETGYHRKGPENNRLPEFKRFFMGCMPDGGMWFSGDRSYASRKLILSTEAKKQGKGGNAIERWGKNKDFCLTVNPESKYLTFYTGEGAAENEILWKHARDNESLWHGKNLINVLKVDAFTHEEIFDSLKKVLKVNIEFAEIEPYLTCTKKLEAFRKMAFRKMAK
jgi:hypothetical protein